MFVYGRLQSSAREISNKTHKTQDEIPGGALAIQSSAFIMPSIASKRAAIVDAIRRVQDIQHKIADSYRSRHC
jgi:hypothetical protein